MKKNSADTERIFLISDLHTDRWTEERRRMFGDFIDYVQKHGSELYVLGDILDFPAMPGKRVWPDHSEVIKRILKLSKSIPVMYLTGNHDIALKAIDIDEKNFKLKSFDAKKPLLRDFGGISAYIEHGHDYDPLFREHVYDTMGLLDRILGTELEILAADFWSDALHVFQRRDKKSDVEPGVPERYLKIWERAAEQILKKRRCNLVIFGHTHAPMILPMLSKDQYYVNTGDWLQHATYVEIHGNRVALMEWPGKSVISEKRFKTSK